MTQTAIRFPVHVGDATPLARSSDPVQCDDAAERAQAFIGNHEQRILRVLRATGKPMTAYEIGARCGLTNVQVLRRTTAIVTNVNNRVNKDSRGRVCSITGRRLETFQAEAT